MKRSLHYLFAPASDVTFAFNAPLFRLFWVVITRLLLSCFHSVMCRSRPVCWRPFGRDRGDGGSTVSVVGGRDVVKLTAQFVARNGRLFLTTVMQREQRNFLFDFLRPQHSLFYYFTRLVEQYTKVGVSSLHHTHNCCRCWVETETVCMDVCDTDAG